jgi:nifR3 family TIM-barrel protein
MSAMLNPFHTCFGLKPDDNPLIFLAPMAGYTNAPMRRISHQHGAVLTYTEMVCDRGLLNTSEKTWHLLETLSDEGPVVAHLYGCEPDRLAEAAAKVEKTGRFVAIDLNAGCPVPKITTCGAGAALIKDPQRIHDILAAMKKALKHIPITIKTRLGPSPDRIAIFDILAAAEAAGASALALHGRFTSQGHGGPVNLPLMAEVKQRAKIPIIGNGGIVSKHCAWTMLHETHVDALMIARAAIGNPWIFEDLRTALKADVEPLPSHSPGSRPQRDLNEMNRVLDDHLSSQQAFLNTLKSKYGTPRDDAAVEENVAAEFRCHLFRYLHGLNGSSHIRGRMHELQTLPAIREAIKACIERESAHRASVTTRLE